MAQAPTGGVSTQSPRFHRETFPCPRISDENLANPLDETGLRGYTGEQTVMGNVTKKDIVEEISRRTGLTQIETKAVLESLLEAISNSLREGRNIEIRGFGRFKVRPKKARTARNPRTGDVVQVQGGLKPVFEASRELRELLNSGAIELSQLQDVLQKAAPELRSAIEG